MQSRHEAREMAFKIMYNMHICENYTVLWETFAEDAYMLEKEYELENRGCPVDDLGENRVDLQVNDLLADIIIKTVNNLDEVDRILAKITEHWALDRINILDRNILRLGIAELTYCPDIPKKVTINEWIEIAKVYSTDDSPKFVNGILDKVANTSKSIKESATT